MKSEMLLEVMMEHVGDVHEGSACVNLEAMIEQVCKCTGRLRWSVHRYDLGSHDRAS